ncbi:MAG: HAD family hydrolase [Deltaproteobacteria bacterium]|nr:MAG: HAD family hydrolase [Deltaproteobacteria bacterium]
MSEVGALVGETNRSMHSSGSSLPRKATAVIFDCDGVMFDSRQANIHFYNHLLEHFGLPPMKDSDVAVVHMATAQESVRHIFRGTPYVEAAQAYRTRVAYTPFIRYMSMEPGLVELLEFLRPRYGLAVATNRSNTIDEVLVSHGIKDYFDIVISSLDVRHPKPHPESIQKILSFFDLSPKQVLYVGDSQVDSDTARAAGVPFVAYKNRGLDADHHIEDLLEIKNILGME